MGRLLIAAGYSHAHTALSGVDFLCKYLANSGKSFGFARDARCPSLKRGATPRDSG